MVVGELKNLRSFWIHPIDIMKHASNMGCPEVIKVVKIPNLCPRVEHVMTTHSHSMCALLELLHTCSHLLLVISQ